MAKIKLDLVNFQDNYRVIANNDNGAFSYKTTDESLAEDVLSVAKKIVNAVDKKGDTPIVETGEIADGGYMILATIEGDEFCLNVDTQDNAYRLSLFLDTFIPF